MKSFARPGGWAEWPLYRKIRYFGKYIADETLVPFVDKIHAKQMAFKLTAGRLSILPVLYEFDIIIEKDDLPDHPCMIKAAHASGRNIFIDQKATIDMSALCQEIHTFREPYRPTLECQYKNIRPRFFIEDVIDDKYHGKNGKALVYMFRCFYGVPHTASVKDGNAQETYDTDWNGCGIIEKPKRFNEMLSHAALLSAPFEFVRIDFFIDVNDIIYFSEFTFTPNGGFPVFSPEEEQRLGQLWR